MKEWVKNIVEPYCKSVIESDNSFDLDQKIVLYIDTYPIHTGDEFTTFIFDEYKSIILIFVPHSCIPIFQPADIGLQHVIKHMLKQELF